MAIDYRDQHPQPSGSANAEVIAADLAAVSALLDSARVGLLRLDPGGVIQRASASAAMMLGVEVEAAGGRTLREFLVDGDSTAARLMARLGAGERVQEAVMLELAGGMAIPATIDASPMFQDAAFSGAVCLLREDFARRQLEHLRRTSELRWMTVADAMPALVAISRSDGEIIYFNRRFEEFAGKRTIELEGDGWLDIVHPDEVPESIERWTNAIARGERVQFQQRLRNKDGEYRTHLCLGEPIRNADGAVEMWIGVNVDVEDRVQSERIVEQALRDAQEREAQQQRAERAIRLSESQYRSLGEAMPVIVATMDVAGRPLYLNRLWYEYTGMAHDQPHESPWRAALHPADYDTVVARWRLGGERGEPVETEYRLRRHDGEFRWFLGRAIPIKDDAGVLTSWVVSTIDIHDRRAAEDALTESEERLRLATEHGRIGVWDWDLLTDEVMMSDVDRELLGLGDAPSTVPIGDVQRVHPADRERLRALVDKAVAERSSFGTEFRIVTAAGEVRWLAASGSVTGDAAHPRMVGTHLDISLRKRAELERDLFADLGESLSSPLDESALLDTIVRTVSPRFAQYCALYTIEADGSVRRTATGDRGDGVAATSTYEIGARPSSPVARALRKGAETFVADMTDEMLVQSAGSPEQLAQFREVGLSSAIVVPMTVRGAVIGALSLATGNARDRFDEADLVTAREVARRVALNIDGARLYADEQQARVRAQLLARASATLAESLDYASTLQAVAQAVVPGFADWCAVDLFDESGTVKRLAVAHVDPAKVKLAHELEERYPTDLSAPSGLGQVLRSRKTECMADIPDELLVKAAKTPEDLEMFRALGLKSSIVSPLVSRERVLGAISFVSAESGRRFSADDIVTAEELARRAVLAIENAELYSKSREAERLLGERLGELETILDNVPVGIAIATDAACTRIIPNGALAQMLHAPSAEVNVSKRDLQGTGWFRLERDGEEIALADLPMQKAGETARPVIGEELDVVYSDAAPPMRLYASAVPLFDDKRGVRGVIGVYVDITERQKMEERLREALRAKDDFLGMVSHELKTPITTVRGNAEILLRRGDELDAELRRQALEDVNRESDRLHRIIENLLMLARIERGQRIEREPLLVTREVARIVQAYRRQNPGRAVAVTADAADLVALGDATHLEQVVSNLLANAEKYSPADTPVDVAIGRSDGMVAVRVLDRGIGVQREEAEAIFSPFYRSPATATTAQGVGIGLSVCKRLVEAHGGTIWCTPREGGGAEFGFTLPELAE